MDLYYFIYSSKIRDHKNNCNASYTNPFQLKICYESIVLRVFSVRKVGWKRNFSQLVYLKSFIHTD